MFIKDTKYAVTNTQADLKLFKSKIIDHVERIQLDIVSI